LRERHLSEQYLTMFVCFLVAFLELITRPHVWQYGTSSWERYSGAGIFELADGLDHESIHDMVENLERVAIIVQFIALRLNVVKAKCREINRIPVCIWTLALRGRANRDMCATCSDVQLFR
jgi:hypothetical protein